MIKTLQLKAVFWIAVAAWTLGLIFTGVPLSETLFKPAAMVLVLITVLVAAFEKWIWKWRLLHPWFVATPNLNGTYKGTIHPLSQVAIESGAPDHIEAYLSIHQTLSSTTVRLYTKESESVSHCCDLRSADDNHWLLRYTYENVPDQRVRSRSPIHFGGVSFTLDGDGFCRLSGNYWTDRITNGEMSFDRINRRSSRSFKEANEMEKLIRS